MLGHTIALLKQVHDVAELIKDALDRERIFMSEDLRSELLSMETAASGPKKLPAKVCGFFNGEPGSCTKGASCGFAHLGESSVAKKAEPPSAVAKVPFSPIVLSSVPANYKTQLCMFYASGKGCYKGRSCSYAHGEKELRGHASAAAAKKVPSTDYDY
jgi:hypothetical protein